MNSFERMADIKENLRRSRLFQKIEWKHSNREFSCPFVFDEPFEHLADLQYGVLGSVMYTVHDFDSFVRRHKDVIIGGRENITTIRRRYELFLELSKGKYPMKGNFIYDVKNKMPIYAKRSNTLFINDLEMLYKMRLLHVFSEERFNEYLDALHVVFDRHKKDNEKNRCGVCPRHGVVEEES